MQLKFTKSVVVSLWGLVFVYFWVIQNIMTRTVGIYKSDSLWNIPMEIWDIHKKVFWHTMTVPHLNDATVVLCITTVLWILLTKATSGQIKKHTSSESIGAARKQIAAYSPGVKYTAVVFWFAVVPIVNLGEEIFFRGVLLFLNDVETLLALYFLPIQGFTWGLVHLTQHKKDFTKEAIVYRMFFNSIEGCLYGGITLASGSIAIPCLLHIGSNFHHFVRGIGSALFSKNPA